MDPLNRDSFFIKQKSDEKTRARNDQIVSDLQDVMQRVEGRRFIWFLLQQSSLMSDPFTGNATTYYILGQQSVVRELLTILNTTKFLGLYRKMQDEAIRTESKQGRNKNG